MLQTILIAIAAVIAAILIYAAMKPNIFKISRAANIQAPPAGIFPFVNNLREHTRWSPFDKGKEMKRAYSGPPEGKGAKLDFDGDKKTGSGSLSVTDSSAPSKVTFRLQMVKPFKCDNTVEFSFVPQGNSTNVTWAMHGPQPYLGKLMSVFINCDKMVGKQFEQGLADLKKLSEQRA